MDKFPKPMLSWKRPGDIPFPNVWYRFKTKPNKDGQSLNIKIVDLTPERHEEAIQFMAKYFLPDEPLRSSVKILDDMNDTMIYLHALKTALENNTSILAVIDEDVPAPEIVGIQVLYVSTEGDPSLRDFKNAGRKIQTVKLIANDLRSVNPFDVFQTNRYLQGFGLGVKPKYRGMNIGYNILLSLETLAKTFGIVGFMSMYSASRSQFLAEKAGFKVYNEVFYEDYKNNRGELLFPIEGTKSFKLMGIKYL